MTYCVGETLLFDETPEQPRSGSEDLSQGINRLIERIALGETGMEAELLEAFDAIPVGSEVIVLPPSGSERLPATYSSKSYSHETTYEVVSGFKADRNVSDIVSSIFRKDVRLDLYIVSGRVELGFRARNNEIMVPLEFDSLGEPLFNLQIRLPEDQAA